MADMHSPATPSPALLALLTLAAGALMAAAAPATPGAAAPTASSPAASATAAATPVATVAATADLSPDATPLFSVSPAPPCHEPLCFWAESHSPGVSLTLSRTHMVMINPEIVDTTRGIAHITADHGEESGPEVGNSRWVFTGHIRADMSDGQLRADTATVQIVNGRIVSINAQGSPALFQRPATNAAAATANGTTTAAAAAGAPPAGAPATATAAAGQKASLDNITVHGHAESITYDAMHDQIEFNGNSWFTDGCNEITSQLVTYDMQTQTIQAGARPGGSARVHGVIRNTHPGAGSSSTCTADSGRS
jgi:lipopolysaccharide export system protein LptA